MCSTGHSSLTIKDAAGGHDGLLDRYGCLLHPDSPRLKKDAVLASCWWRVQMPIMSKDV